LGTSEDDVIPKAAGSRRGASRRGATVRLPMEVTSMKFTTLINPLLLMVATCSLANTTTRFRLAQAPSECVTNCDSASFSCAKNCGLSGACVAQCNATSASCKAACARRSEVPLRSESQRQAPLARADSGETTSKGTRDGSQQECTVCDLFGSGKHD
jgi:hypothetical protein